MYSAIPTVPRWLLEGADRIRDAYGVPPTLSLAGVVFAAYVQGWNDALTDPPTAQGGQGSTEEQHVSENPIYDTTTAPVDAEETTPEEQSADEPTFAEVADHDDEDDKNGSVSQS